MKKVTSYLFLAVLLSITGVSMSARLLMHRQGRNLKAVSLNSNSPLPQPDRFRTIGDFEQSGQFSLLRGSTIQDYFRAQIPAVPLVSTQAKRLNIDPESTYLITTERTVFERLRWLVEDVRVYESQGHKLDGVRYPGAFVLESDRTPSYIRRLPYRPPATSYELKRDYLYLPGHREAKLFFSGPRPERKINLILPDSKYLKPGAGHQDYLPKLSSIYVLGKNAIVPSEWELISPGILFVLPSDMKVNPDLFQGILEPFPKYYYDYGLILAGFSLTILGILLSDQLLFWVLFAVIFFSLKSTVSWSQPMLSAMLGMGALSMAWKNRGLETVFWVLLAGVMMFSWSYQPFRLDPLVGQPYFELALIVGIPLTLLVQGLRLDEPLTRADSVALFLGCILILLTGDFVFGKIVSNRYFGFLMVLTPILILPFRSLRRQYRWVLMAAIGSWGIFFYSVEEYSMLATYLLSALLWGLWEVLSLPRNGR